MKRLIQLIGTFIISLVIISAPIITGLIWKSDSEFRIVVAIATFIEFIVLWEMIDSLNR